MNRLKTGFRATAPLAMVAALWVAAACGSSGALAAAPADPADSADPIPAGVSMIGRVDVAAILADDALADLYAALPTDTEGPATLEAAMAMAAEDFGVDPTKISEILFFSIGSDKDGLGLILTGDLNVDDLMAAISASGDKDLFVAALPDGRLVAGGVEAVRRVLAVAEGEAEGVAQGVAQGVAGDLKSRFDALGSPWVKVVADVSADDAARLLGEDGPAGAVMGFLPINLTAFEDVRTVSLVLDKRGGEFVMEAEVGFTSADSAAELGKMIDGMVGLVKGFVPDADAVAFLDGLAVSTTGADVSIDFRIDTDDAVKLVEDIFTLIPGLGS